MSLVAFPMQHVDNGMDANNFESRQRNGIVGKGPARPSSPKPATFLIRKQFGSYNHTFSLFANTKINRINQFEFFVSGVANSA